MSNALKSTEAALDNQMINCVTKLPAYKATLGLTDETIAERTADSVCFSYVLKMQKSMATYAQNVTEFKDLVRYGNGHDVITQMPVMPDLGVAPLLVAAGVQQRFSFFVQALKKHKNYTDAIGLDLGIVATTSSFAPSDGKPMFFIDLSNGGHPHIKWVKGGYGGVEIWKNIGTGFTLLDKVTKPDFYDKMNLPEHGSSAIWTYRMIYLYKDERVGTWSDDVNVTVMGSL